MVAEVILLLHHMCKSGVLKSEVPDVHICDRLVPDTHGF